MKKVIVMMLLAMMVAGCSSKTTYLADTDDDVATYVLPKGMKFVSYDSYCGNVIIRKARPGEEPETYYLFRGRDNIECTRKYVER